LSRLRRYTKPLIALLAFAGLAIALSACAFIKPGSLTLSQPAGIGSVRVHFALCTLGTELCSANEDEGNLQYLIGIAAPPGATPPSSFTASPVKGGAPIVFTRNDEVATEMAAAAASIQQFLSKEPLTPEERKEAELLLGGAWPPSGLQGFGYLSAPVQDTKGENLEWSVDADFGLPAASGTPFTGPFGTGIAFGFREVTGPQPASRSVHCVKFVEGVMPQEGEALCTGSLQQTQAGTSNLRISAPAKTAQGFVGGSAQVPFPLEFAGTAATVPTFALSATTTVKGGTAKLSPTTYTPAAPDPSTHLSKVGTGSVTVSLPKNTKVGTYQVTLTAATAQGGVVTGTANLKVTKPTLKLGKAKLNKKKGTAKLSAKISGAGTVTLSGKGIVSTKGKAKKAKTLKLTVKPKGKTKTQLGKTGAAKVKVKVTFKPSSGISVTKKKGFSLKQSG
jgi:methionine-rich copper-binding protein CopC